MKQQQIFSNITINVWVMLYLYLDLDGYTYEFDEEPLSNTQDQTLTNEAAAYSFGKLIYHCIWWIKRLS